MIFKYFFLLLLTPAIAGVTRDKSWLRKYLPADEWAYNRLVEIEEYDAFRLTEGLKFYSKPDLSGEPEFVINNSWISFKNGESCQPQSKKYYKKVDSFLSCKPFRCHQEKNSKGELIQLTDPFNFTWYSKKSDGKASDKECSRKFSFIIHRTYRETAVFYHWIVPKNGPKTIEVDGVTYYPDISMKHIPKTVSKNSCYVRYGMVTNDCVVMFETGVASGKYQMGDFPLSDEEVSQCFAKDSGKLKECLQKFTFKKAADERLMPFKLPPVEWTTENIAELKVCIQKKEWIMRNGIYGKVFKGNSKKCLIGGGLIYAVEWPEAFVFHDPLSEGVANIEISDNHKDL